MKKKTHQAQKNISSKKIADLIVFAIKEKKGVNPRTLDLRKLSTIADYFVVVSGTSDRHLKTLAEGVEDYLRLKGIRPLHHVDRSVSSWVALDYGAVVVHVFLNETRKFYGLERLWGVPKKVRKPKKKF